MFPACRRWIINWKSKLNRRRLKRQSSKAGSWGPAFLFDLLQPELLQLVAMTPAQGQLGTVTEDDRVFSMKKRLQFFDPFAVDDGRSADADELFARQARFKISHGFTQQ